MRLYARYLALLTFITAGVCLVVIHMQGPTLPPMPARDRSPMVPERTRSGKTPFEVTAQTLATASHVTKYKFEHFVRTYTPSAGPARSHHITNFTVITAGRSAEGRKKSTFTTPVSTNVKKVNKPTTRPLMLPHAPYVKVNESDGKMRSALLRNKRRAEQIRSVCDESWNKFLPVQQQLFTTDQQAGATNNSQRTRLSQTPAGIQARPRDRVDWSEIIVDVNHRLVYCPIEKVGSSFWKRVFAILRNRMLDEISVFRLSSVAVHRSGRYDTLRKKPLSQRQYLLTSPAFQRFLFVRDPYERLFSGYIDKLFLPTFETDRLAMTINKHVRKGFTNYGSNEKSHDREPLDMDPSEEAPSPRLRRRNRFFTKTCQLNVTFADFVRYVTNDVGVGVNYHFMPIYRKCSPCKMDFTFVGKMESFREDVNAVLKWAGVDLAQLVDGDDDSFDKESDVSIMRDVMLRTLSQMNRYSPCFSAGQMLRRLWATFQIRGYLSIEEPFPLTDKQAAQVSSLSFFALLNEAYIRSGSPELRKGQRRAAMLEAYYTLPRDLLSKLESFVDRDCKLFGYDCSVESRFNPKKRPEPMFHFDQLLGKGGQPRWSGFYGGRAEPEEGRQQRKAKQRKVGP